MKHWLDLLEDAGNPVEKKASYLKMEYEALSSSIRKQILYIEEKEQAALQFVKGEWSDEEIKAAQALSDYNLEEIKKSLKTIFN